MANYAKHLKQTPQSEPLPGKNMVKNAAGGYAFKLAPLDVLRRFLILGSEDGTFYVSERKLTVDSVTSLLSLLATPADATNAIAEIVRVSHGGLASRNKPALFALAVCAAFKDGPHATVVRQMAFLKLGAVARTLSDLYYFMTQYQSLKGTRGLGRAARRAIGNWFAEMPAARLEEQVMKYRQREGWAAVDLMRMSHLGTQEKAKIARPYIAPEKNDALKWAKNTRLDAEKRYVPESPRLLAAHKAIFTPAEFNPSLIETLRLPREVIPDELLKKRETWEALLPHMPPHALLRNLNRMTIAGVEPRDMTSKLTSAKALQQARLHPLTVLMAMHTYSQGRGFKGSLSWTPHDRVIDALNDAFYLVAKAAPRIKQKVLVAIDSSGSMTGAAISGYANLVAVKAAAALAMSIDNIADDAAYMLFDRDAAYTSISKRRRLDDLMESLNRRGGMTNCAAPLELALREKKRYEAIVLITDNESWAGQQHAVQALATYRAKFGRTKFISVATTATLTSVADPNDVDTLNAVGFSADLGAVLSNFIGG